MIKKTYELLLYNRRTSQSDKVVEISQCHFLCDRGCREDARAWVWGAVSLWMFEGLLDCGGCLQMYVFSLRVLAPYACLYISDYKYSYVFVCLYHSIWFVCLCHSICVMYVFSFYLRYVCLVILSALCMSCHSICVMYVLSLYLRYVCLVILSSLCVSCHSICLLSVFVILSAYVSLYSSAGGLVFVDISVVVYVYCCVTSLTIFFRL